jgi:hypothetical protein
MSTSDLSAASRRGFLRRFGASATLAAATPLSAVSVSGDLYINHRVGLAFSKPQSWRYEHVSTFADIRNEYEYATPDEQLATELRQGPLPVVVVSKAPVLRFLASSVTVYVEQSPLESGESLASVAGEIIRGTSTFVKDFRLLGEPVMRTVAGSEALEYLFSFLYEDRIGNRGPVRHRSLAVLGSSLLYTFNMLDIPADRIDSQLEFDAVRDSIFLA